MLLLLYERKHYISITVVCEINNNNNGNFKSSLMWCYLAMVVVVVVWCMCDPGIWRDVLGSSIAIRISYVGQDKGQAPGDKKNIWSSRLGVGTRKGIQALKALLCLILWSSNRGETEKVSWGGLNNLRLNNSFFKKKNQLFKILLIKS